MQLKQDMQQAQMQDKQTASSQSDSQRKKFHMINKLRKAVQHANALELLCRKLKPVRLVLGRIMLDFAAGGCGDQTGSASVLRMDARQSPFRRPRLEEGDGGVYKITANTFALCLQRLIAAQREKELIDKQSQIVWCGHALNLSSPDKVAALHRALRQFDAELAQAISFDDKMSTYEKFLVDCRDAVQAVRDHAKGEGIGVCFWASNIIAMHSEQQNQKAAAAVPTTGTKSAKSSKSVGAQQPQQKTMKHVDVVRLYDNLLANLNEMDCLVGVDDALLRQLNRQKLYYTAFRSYHVAGAYAAQKKYAEAIAVYGGAVEHIERASEALATMDASDSNDQVSRANMPPLLATPDKYHMNLIGADVLAGKVPLVRLPPQYEPIPMKPLFFDLAHNHVKFPSLDDKIDQPKDEKKPQNKDSKAPAASGDDQSGTADGGISTTLTRWFWGKK
ncbi:unnamed protein product [Sphagnum balticum]